MERDFWLQRWSANEIGFHEGKPNDLLTANLGALGLQPGGRIFAPLCGKSVDLHWLLGNGLRVCGVELSRLAIDQLFNDLGVTPQISEGAALMRYSAPQIEIFVGDIFELTAEALGPVDAFYDRAALVALPEPMRVQYAEQVIALTKAAPQLLIAFDYDQQAMNGPPFAIPEQTVRRLYEQAYEVVRLDERAVEGGLKGQCAATETAWLLRSRAAQTGGPQDAAPAR